MKTTEISVRELYLRYRTIDLRVDENVRYSSSNYFRGNNNPSKLPPGLTFCSDVRNIEDYFILLRAIY